LQGVDICTYTYTHILYVLYHILSVNEIHIIQWADGRGRERDGNNNKTREE
jgi:hypothetical protein